MKSFYNYLLRGLTMHQLAAVILTVTFLISGTGTVVFAQTPATAAPTRQIDGTVLDRQGLPINGAKVTVTEKPGSLQKSAQSTTGKFKVDGLNSAS